MTEKLMRYCIDSDERVPVTQEWVDAAQRRLFEFASQRNMVRKLLNSPFVDEENIVRVPGQ